MNKDKTSCSRPINLLSFLTIKCNKIRGRAEINVRSLKAYFGSYASLCISIISLI